MGTTLAPGARPGRRQCLRGEGQRGYLERCMAAWIEAGIGERRSEGFGRIAIDWQPEADLSTSKTPAVCLRRPNQHALICFVATGPADAGTPSTPGIGSSITCLFGQATPTAQRRKDLSPMRLPIASFPGCASCCVTPNARMTCNALLACSRPPWMMRVIQGGYARAGAGESPCPAPEGAGAVPAGTHPIPRASTTNGWTDGFSNLVKDTQSPEPVLIWEYLDPKTERLSTTTIFSSLPRLLPPIFPWNIPSA